MNVNILISSSVHQFKCEAYLTSNVIFYFSHLDDLQMFNEIESFPQTKCGNTNPKEKISFYCKHQLIMSIMKINKLLNALINYQIILKNLQQHPVEIYYI